MAEQTARGICPEGVVVVPLQPPPSSVLAVAWRQGDDSALLGRLLSFVRACRDPST